MQSGTAHLHAALVRLWHTAPRDPAVAAPTHNSKQSESQAGTALPACCAKCSSEQGFGPALQNKVLQHWSVPTGPVEHTKVKQQEFPNQN